jgi:hypothetical protein
VHISKVHDLLHHRNVSQFLVEKCWFLANFSQYLVNNILLSCKNMVPTKVSFFFH